MQKVAKKWFKKFGAVSMGTRIMVVCLALIASGAVFKYGQHAQSTNCLAHLVYVEARGMTEQAQYDVAHSVLNRVAANRAYFGGDTVCGVVYYRQDGVWQYSGVAREFGVPPEDMKSWEQSMKIARDVVTGEVKPKGAMRDALYYLNPRYSNPRSLAWFRNNLQQIGTSGSHVFYTDKK